jgi:hypothetical protein
MDAVWVRNGVLEKGPVPPPLRGFELDGTGQIKHRSKAGQKERGPCHGTGTAAAGELLEMRQAHVP